MGILQKIFTGGGKEIADAAGDLYEKVQSNRLGKRELEMEVKHLVQAQVLKAAELVEAETEAKRSIMTAELQQGDEYTKRTRPWILRVMTKYVLVITSLAVAAEVAEGIEAVKFEWQMPDEVKWLLGVYAGLVGVYKIGRSAQHVWPGNRFIQSAMDIAPRVAEGRRDGR